MHVAIRHETILEIRVEIVGNRLERLLKIRKLYGTHLRESAQLPHATSLRRNWVDTNALAFGINGLPVRSSILNDTAIGDRLNDVGILKRGIRRSRGPGWLDVSECHGRIQVIGVINGGLKGPQIAVGILDLRERVRSLRRGA